MRRRRTSRRCGVRLRGSDGATRRAGTPARAGGRGGARGCARHSAAASRRRRSGSGSRRAGRPATCSRPERTPSAHPTRTVTATSRARLRRADTTVSTDDHAARRARHVADGRGGRLSPKPLQSRPPAARAATRRHPPGRPPHAGSALDAASTRRRGAGRPPRPRPRAEAAPLSARKPLPPRPPMVVPSARRGAPSRALSRRCCQTRGSASRR